LILRWIALSLVGLVLSGCSERRVIRTCEASRTRTLDSTAVSPLGISGAELKALVDGVITVIAVDQAQVPFSLTLTVTSDPQHAEETDAGFEESLTCPSQLEIAARFELTSDTGSLAGSGEGFVRMMRPGTLEGGVVVLGLAAIPRENFSRIPDGSQAPTYRLATTLAAPNLHGSLTEASEEGDPGKGQPTPTQSGLVLARWGGQ
jgi:hypothetical protein